MSESELTVSLPISPPATSQTETSIAIAIGELKGELSSLRSTVEELRSHLHANPAGRENQETAPLVEAVRSLEEAVESLTEEPENEEPPAVTEVVLPPPEHHAEADPITAESMPPPLAEKRFLGMLHGW